MHHRPGYLLVLGQFDELDPLDHCLRASAPNCVRVTWFILLHRWFRMVIVAFGVEWIIHSPGALADIVTVARFGTASMPSLWFLPRGVIFRIVTITFLGHIHHIYVV